MEYFLRFIIGGLVVSIFAVLGDILEPKSFAGIFGAAPSIALATLALTIHSESATYAAIEVRSMIAGAIALLVYAWLASWSMMRHDVRASISASALIPVWLVTAFGIWLLFARLVL
jgi:uncharacterized membrane protein (GlpM family)